MLLASTVCLFALAIAADPDPVADFVARSQAYTAEQKPAIREQWGHAMLKKKKDPAYYARAGELLKQANSGRLLPAILPEPKQVRPGTLGALPTNVGKFLKSDAATVTVKIDSLLALTTVSARGKPKPNYTITIQTDPQALKQEQGYVLLPFELYEVVSVDPPVYKPASIDDISAKARVRFIEVGKIVDAREVLEDMHDDPPGKPREPAAGGPS